MPENNDYNCKVCGKHFSEEDDYKNHGEQDHPEVNEAYPEIFDKKEKPREEKEAEEFDWSEVPEDEWDDVVLRKVNGDKEEEEPAEEIDQQVDKPVQTHDDWVKELEGIKDEFSEEGGAGSGPQRGGTALLPEQSAMKNINPEYDPFKATPKSQLMQTDPYITRTTEEAPPTEDELVWNSETHHYDKAKEQEEDSDNEKEEELPWIVDDQEGDNTAEEEGDSSGADDPLAKVADLAESYRYMSRDSRASLFESLKFTQGDSAILAGLEWNELTRPVKVEASEAYVKGQEEPEKEAEETEEDEEDKAYENLYNLEKYHSSPDYKKKAITCNRCNEAFYNTNDRNIHYNDVHATEQDYKLPETCPYCNIEINEPDNLDWHMQEEHGAHVPSQYTQTGLQGAMADTDFDSLESHKKKAGENELDLCPICQDGMKCEDLMSHAPNWNTTNNWSTNGIEPPNANESYAKEDYIPAPYDQHFNWVASMDQDDYVCKHCGQQMMNRDGTNALHSAPESEIIDVVKQHLSTHGITEAKAKEARLDSEGYPICQICGETIKGDEDILFDLTNNVTQHLLNHGKSESEVAEIQHKMLMGGAMESRSASDLREEIKKQENFINLASHENPMNMGDAQNKLDGLRSELESLGGEDLGATEQEEDEGWGSPEETAKDIYDLGHPEEAEEQEEPVEKWDKDDDIGRNYAEPTGDDEPLDDDSYWQGRMEEAEEENKCEGCGKAEDFLNDDSLCEDCEREAGIDRKESERDAYEATEVKCKTCGEDFNSDEQLEEHQYAYYHGKYEDEGEGEDMPRNVMGGQ